VEDFMVYITGDIHGNPEFIIYRAQQLGLTKEDTLVLLGDVGANYYLNKRDDRMKEAMSKYIEATILCIHGNHEERPSNIAGYQVKVWNEGLVYFQDEYPNILFAVDGSIFNLGGKKCIALGGAYSVDKYYRLESGYAWFESELPTEAIKAYAAEQLEANSYKVDVVFSHTCPFKYEPIEMFISGIDQSKVDDSTERWLDEIEDKLDYKAWYCGHWHCDKNIDKLHFLFTDWLILEDLK
jgi:3-oxoacid CoA-transferase subunit A